MVRTGVHRSPRAPPYAAPVPLPVGAPGPTRAPGTSRFVPRDRPLERVGRCLVGLGLFGVGIAMLLRAELGAAPWDVFHTGVARLVGASTGVVIVATGVALLALWVPLRERPGLGTILNAVVVGVVVDLASPLLGHPEALAVRVPMMLGGVVLVAIGSGSYMGAGLGPGPRDGLMTGVARVGLVGRPVSIRAARTGVEVLVLLVGIALGGAVGVGTAVFALGIGPLVQVLLPPLQLDHDPR